MSALAFTCTFLGFVLGASVHHLATSRLLRLAIDTAAQAVETSGRAVDAATEANRITNEVLIEVARRAPRPANVVPFDRAGR